MSAVRPDTLQAALARVFDDDHQSRASWFALTAGEKLFSAGDPADTFYLLRAGRLGVFAREEGQPPRFLGVVKPGDPVGEMAMLAGTSHTADVVALRDSDLLALPREAFFDATRDHPELMAELARVMIRRARQKNAGEEATVFGFISARPRPIRAFVERLAAAIQAQGRSCRVVDHAALSSASEWFSRVEGAHDYVLYVAEADEPAWAALCARQVDRLFVVGDALYLPPPGLTVRDGSELIHQLTDLILLRDPRMEKPANTAVWLDALAPARWFHAVEGSTGDVDRIARVITGISVGLVLSGGGARAYAHIGVLRALRAAEVPIDFLGGASMGAVVAAGPALGWSQEELERRIRKAFVVSDPLSDIALPLVAMTRAGKVARLMQEAYGEVDMADMPLPFYAVSTNLTAGRIEVHRRGLLRQALRASISIPGVMPPVVVDGQVMVDGAVLRNFPSEVMRQLNRGPMIGSDVSQARGVDAQQLENPPSWWRWIASGAWKEGPPIVSILMRSATLTTDAELAEARAETDLLIQPAPHGVDIRDWKAYEPAVAAGYDAAVAALASLSGPIQALRRSASGPDIAPEGTAAETATGAFHQTALERPRRSGLRAWTDRLVRGRARPPAPSGKA